MDIVEQLRHHKSSDVWTERKDRTWYETDDLCMEAADEIKRLRVLVREAFDEGFNEGKNGGWIVGPNFPWKKSYSRAKLVGAALAVAALKESE